MKYSMYLGVYHSSYQYYCAGRLIDCNTTGTPMSDIVVYSWGQSIDIMLINLLGKLLLLKNIIFLRIFVNEANSVDLENSFNTLSIPFGVSIVRVDSGNYNSIHNISEMELLSELKADNIEDVDAKSTYFI